jgi:hypothetical protein
MLELVNEDLELVNILTPMGLRSVRMLRLLRNPLLRMSPTVAIGSVGYGAVTVLDLLGITTGVIVQRSNVVPASKHPEGFVQVEERVGITGLIEQDSFTWMGVGNCAWFLDVEHVTHTAGRSLNYRSITLVWIVEDVYHSPESIVDISESKVHCWSLLYLRLKFSTKQLKTEVVLGNNSVTKFGHSQTVFVAGLYTTQCVNCIQILVGLSGIHNGVLLTSTESGKLSLVVRMTMVLTFEGHQQKAVTYIPTF